MFWNNMSPALISEFCINKKNTLDASQSGYKLYYHGLACFFLCLPLASSLEPVNHWGRLPEVSL